VIFLLVLLLQWLTNLDIGMFIN